MQTAEENIVTNREHYDRLYSGANIDALVDKVRNVAAFLEVSIKTDTSWHGLYQDGFADRIKNKRVFEIGCGNGLNALVMAALGAEVVANDISQESERILKQAVARLGFINVEAVSGNFADLHFPFDSFDFVVGKALLHHLTHDLEAQYLKKLALMLKVDGEARFFEPATNSLFLDKLRWMVPVPGRPSILNKEQFAKWKQGDAHPERDNSSTHFRDIGRSLFKEVEITPLGSIERFCRLLPNGNFKRRFRRWAHRAELKLPMPFRRVTARSQLIVYRQRIIQTGCIKADVRPKR